MGSSRHTESEHSQEFLPERNSNRPAGRPLLVLLLAVAAGAGVFFALWDFPDPAAPLPDGPFLVVVSDAEGGGEEGRGDASIEAADTSPDALPEDDLERRFADARRKMVALQLKGRDITDKHVLAAMETVPRHRFVPDELRRQAYTDRPLPIGEGQTISQPYIVALMTQLAEAGPKKKALDVGTGSGYQAAVLAEICEKVYSIEIVESLAQSAAARLKTLGYKNITVRLGDGYRGWKEHARFDLIVVAAAPEKVPQPLIDQLAVGGRLVIPVGSRFRQTLLVLEKRPDGTIDRHRVAPVAFVPMTGEAEKK